MAEDSIQQANLPEKARLRFTIPFSQVYLIKPLSKRHRGKRLFNGRRMDGQWPDIMLIAAVYDADMDSALKFTRKSCPWTSGKHILTGLQNKSG